MKDVLYIYVSLKASSQLLQIYSQSRGIPRSFSKVEVFDGIFVSGFMTSDALIGSRGILNHIYQQHGSHMQVFFWKHKKKLVKDALHFLSIIQRLTTSTSIYSYCSSVGLDDCLLSPSIRSQNFI